MHFKTISLALFTALAFSEGAHAIPRCHPAMEKTFHCDGSREEANDEGEFRRWCARPPRNEFRAEWKAEFCSVPNHSVHRKQVCQRYVANNCAQALRGGSAGRGDCKGMGARGCQNAAREEQKRGQQQLAQQKNDLLSAITDAGQLANKALMDAADYLTNWSDKVAAQNPADPQELQALKHDDALLRRAIKSHDDKQVSFTEQDADTAKSQSMGELLKFAALTRDVKEMEEDSAREVDVAQLALTGLEGRTASRAENLGTVGYPQANKGLLSASGISGKTPAGLAGASGAKGAKDSNGNSDITGTGDKLDSGDGQTLKIGGGRSLASSVGKFGSNSAGTGEEGASQAGDAGQLPRYKGGSLRDLLRTRMEKGSADGKEEKEEKEFADKDALEGATFGKGVGGLYAEEKLNQEGADRTGAKPGFSMGLDVKGHAKSFFEDVIPNALGDQEAHDEIESGVLGSESKNLFQRVHEAHKASQRRRNL